MASERGGMMSRLIREEDVIREIDKWLDNVGTAYVGKGLSYYGELLGCISDAPTVDANPVVHAEWIDIQPDYHSGFYGNVHKCSNCGDYYTTEYDDLFFCPRCGAKMDGKKVQE
jgi:hypothetical protein